MAVVRDGRVMLMERVRSREGMVGTVGSCILDGVSGVG